MKSKKTTLPPQLLSIEAKTRELGFTMASGRRLGALLRTLAAAKPGARLLELGTGTGLSLAWLADGMDTESVVISIDNDKELIALARSFFPGDTRIHLLHMDAASWITSYEGEPFELVFADAWPGKYSHLPALLNLVKPGGLYIVDDLIKQPTWPAGHKEHVSRFLKFMETHPDFYSCFLGWDTGILIATKK